MRAKRGYGNEVSDLKAKRLELTRSVKGWVFWGNAAESSEYKQVRVKINEIDNRLKEITW